MKNSLKKCAALVGALTLSSCGNATTDKPQVPNTDKGQFNLLTSIKGAAGNAREYLENLLLLRGLRIMGGKIENTVADKVDPSGESACLGADKLKNIAGEAGLAVVQFLNTAAGDKTDIPPKDEAKKDITDAIELAVRELICEGQRRAPWQKEEMSQACAYSNKQRGKLLLCFSPDPQDPFAIIPRLAGYDTETNQPDTSVNDALAQGWENATASAGDLEEDNYDE